VTTLAVAQSTDTSVTAFAGINSSTADQNAGRNEHLRSFQLSYPPRKSTNESEKTDTEKSTYNGKTTALGRVSLFKPSSAKRKETYQRLLRLSAAGLNNSQRTGAIATGLAPEGEIVIFRASSTPNESDELGRITLEKGEEAADLDIITAEDGEHDVLAYCTDIEVYRYEISRAGHGPHEPQFLYGLPPPDAFASSPARHKFRSLRFLNPHTMLLLRNRAGKAGADLLVLRYTEEGLGNITLNKRLHKSMKAAIALEVCFLPESTNGERQIIIAVAGQDNTIELLTLEDSRKKGLSVFRPFTILRDIHPAGITQMSFSQFPSPPTSDAAAARPQYVKLASVSFANTVVVHTLPLTRQQANEPKNTRYILAKSGSSEVLQTTFSLFMAIFVIGIAAFFLQAFTEIRGGIPPTLGAVDWLSPRVRAMIAQPYNPSSAIMNTPIIPTEIPSVEDVRHKLADLITQQSTQENPKAIIVRDVAGTELSTEVHHGAEIVEREVRRWEELHEHEKEGWRKRLTDAGHWTADQGEAILKGVFFSELAGMVGEIVRGA